MAGRLAVLTGSGVCSGADAFAVLEDGALQLGRMVYGGAAAATARAAGRTIALVGGGLFEAACLPAAGSVETVTAAPVSCGAVCTAVSRKEEERVDLAAAKRVVSAGRGIGAKENLTLLEALARKMGAELACSRPIAEGEHWMPKNRYVGVSGAVIKPEVYVACGISGQVQHLVGIREAKTVIAINKDKNAPIFKNCDYGIVGDLNKVVPALTEKL
ncbi:Protein FixB [bioreactor metagenome]|uniref:Protein FixB n=1 Tax=bioreactor metagenome TaxID=1076179 RepID=A0A645GX19_9ZZZZ